MMPRIRTLTVGTLAVLCSTTFGSIGWSAAMAGDGVEEGMTESASSMVQARTVRVPGTETVVRTYMKVDEFGNMVSHYSVSQDGGVTWSRDRESSPQLLLRYAGFDPLVSLPIVHPELRADSGNRMFIVQFITQPLEEYQRKIIEMGGVVRQFISNNAMIVEIDGDVKDSIGELPFVRWVGALQPAYKAEERILNEFFPLDDHALAAIGGVADEVENGHGTSGE